MRATIVVRPSKEPIHDDANGRADARDPYDPAARKGYLSVDDYFMTLAFLSGQRSKDPRKQASVKTLSLK